MAYIFDWDPTKAEANRQKHGVTFDEARTAFSDPLSIVIPAARYAEGTNVVVIAPDVLDVFPDGRSVNEALRALEPMLRKQRKRRSA